MKYVAIGAAIVAVSLGLFFAFLFGVANKATGKIGQDAENYLRRELPPIIRDWDTKALTERSAPQLLAENPPPKIRDMMGELRRRLGRLQTLDQVKVTSLIAPQEGGAGQQDMIALGEAQATFEKGSATFDIRLARQEGRWRFARFVVRGN